MYDLCICMFVCMWQIVANIYEPQGISHVEAHATFLSNELLPLVEKIVMDKKVRHTAGLKNLSPKNF